jgi:hypothetical protein
MKAISASIIVLAGAIIFATGAIVQHDDTQLFVCFVGAGLGMIGLLFWTAAYFKE